MAEYLLDTNHVSPLVTLGHPLRELVVQQARDGDTFSLPVPVVTELVFGLSLLPRASQNLSEWRLWRARIGYYIVDQATAENAAALQTALRRQGRQLATVDALIAATALRYDLTLLTTDRDFETITGLRRENWMS